MKKTIWTMGLAAVLCGTSCSDVIDLYPGDRFSAATVWSSTTTVDSYVLGLYSIIGVNSEVYGSGAPKLSDAYSDILKCGDWDLYGTSFNKTLFQESAFNSTGAGAFECWNAHYDRIRRENEFLRDAPAYKEKFGEDWINTRMAEVRFCRAYAYFLLCRVYGGVILRTEVDGPEENNKARSSEEDCWNFIITELQELAPMLPKGNKGVAGEDWDSSNYGRVTQQSAYGLLSRVGLYAQRWDVAVDAARKVAECGADLDWSGYENVFKGDLQSNKEILLGVDFAKDVITHRYDQYVRPSGDGTPYKYTLYSIYAPTSELVDSYEMADGSEFSWEKYGTNPYENREPRFYATILYNGASWMGRTLQTYVGGEDGYTDYENAGSANTTVTGYYLRKYLQDNETDWITRYSDQTWIIIRYAEVLLNKAEALAELNWSQNSAEALQALNDVRRRVGLPARQTASKEEFMEYLRHERMVELAGEGFRYWDLRRWRLADKVINGSNVHGVKITKKADNTFTYEQVDADAGNKRIFYDRYYHFAIPEDERSKNPLCTNNEGWV